MGIDTIPVRYDVTTILAMWFNILRDVITGDWVPRNSSGVATANAGSLGTATYPWLRAEISSGGFSIGDIKPHHSYNGAVPIGHGWMLCDGRIITEANYNTEHGASTWATYVGSSALLNKYLPNMTSRYLVGAATTTQTGAGTITSVGNASHQVNLAHTHTVNDHLHAWYTDATAANAKSYNASGTVTTIGAGTKGYFGIRYVDTNSDMQLSSSLYTSKLTGLATNSGASATQNIQPDSIEVLYYMRVI